jgi:hypothetical protein
MMPKPRRKSSIRTASGATQEQFLERVRQVAEDPTLVLPESLGPEPGPLARMRAKLQRAKQRGLPFTARFDKGLLGALRGAKQIAQMESAPRLLDARVDGNRRFFLQRGHAHRLVGLGVQNWDDPLALLLAWGRFAPKHGINLWAGSKLWAGPAPPPQWFDDLAERTGIEFSKDGDGAQCPHKDEPRIELRFPDGPRILACGECAQGSVDESARNLHGHVINRACVAARTSRPVDVQARLPDGTAIPLQEGLVRAYRNGRNSEEDLLRTAVRSWRDEAGQAGRRFVLGARDFGGDQDAFLSALELAEWEREPVRVLTEPGHVGDTTRVADVLASHRERAAAAVETMLPGQGAVFVARHPGVETRTLLRLAHEEAQRKAKTRDLPAVPGLGELGQWIDGLARDARAKSRGELLQRLRREAPSARHPAHFYAYLCALGLESEGARTTSQDAKEAGRHWAPLAKSVLEASGEAYAEAVRAYLRETGAGEGA